MATRGLASIGKLVEGLPDFMSWYQNRLDTLIDFAFYYLCDHQQVIPSALHLFHHQEND